ncbi:MAG: GNAT family N-acetyltransferase, partial [Desulfobacteraceae bacterium]|nr:GNAT family N-acetyltransferase [Desulfobacteraceae bacterium]
TKVDDLKFVLGEERDKTNQPYVGQWEFDEHQAAIGNDDIAHWIVARPSDDQRIGYVILQGMTNPHNNIELMRIVISEKNKGIGRKTLCLIQRAAFSIFNAHRLWLDVRENNPRAKHLYLSEGFVEEGTLRECIKLDDGYVSLRILSILRQEWLERDGVRHAAATGGRI